MRPETTGWVDHVVTPVGAFAYLVAEDAVDRYFVHWLEKRVGNRTARAALRIAFNPSRALANMAERAHSVATRRPADRVEIALQKFFRCLRRRPERTIQTTGGTSADGDQPDHVRSAQARRDFRASLAGRRAVVCVPDLVPVRHRDDVLGLPRRLGRAIASSDSPALDASTVRLSPEQAYATVAEGPLPAPVRLNSFDGRPVYRFGNEGIVYADTGEVQSDVSPELMLRVASAWTGQPADAARIESVEEVDQWTVGGVFRFRPLWKYSWPNGEQVYVSGNSGEVVQYTTTGSRLGAYVGAIPHWFYFTPLRKHGPQWSRVVIWSSGIGTFAALLGCRDWRLDVFPVEAVSQCRRGDQHSVSRTEALAHAVRSDFRARRRDVGVQRHAVDGSVSVAERRAGRRPARAGRREHPADAARPRRDDRLRSQASARGAGADLQSSGQGTGIHLVCRRSDLPRHAGGR